MIGLDLAAAVFIDSADVASELRKRLGTVFLLEREDKDWSRSYAATRVGVDSGVIRRIEKGDNYKFDAAEAYARSLGRTLEGMLWLVLTEMRQSSVLESHPAKTVSAETSIKRRDRDGHALAVSRSVPSTDTQSRPEDSDASTSVAAADGGDRFQTIRHEFESEIKKSTRPDGKRKTPARKSPKPKRRARTGTDDRRRG